MFLPMATPKRRLRVSFRQQHRPCQTSRRRGEADSSDGNGHVRISRVIEATWSAARKVSPARARAARSSAGCSPSRSGRARQSTRPCRGRRRLDRLDNAAGSAWGAGTVVIEAHDRCRASSQSELPQIRTGQALGLRIAGGPVQQFHCLGYQRPAPRALAGQQLRRALA